MTIDQIIVPMMILAAIAGGILTIAHIVGVFLYDARSLRHKRAYERHPYALKFRTRPLITVLISAYNDADSIMYTLNSILKSSYRNVEMLVVDLGSEDYTKAVVKGYIEQHPKQAIRLIMHREGEGIRRALTRAVKHYSGGELVLSIPAGGYIDRDALHCAVHRFADDESIDVLNVNRYIESHASIIGLFERYYALLAQRTDKFLSMAGLLVNIRRMSVYRRSVYLRVRDSSHPKVHYAHDVTVGVPALGSYRKVFIRNYRAYVRTLRRLGIGGKSWLQLGYISCSIVLSLTSPLLIGYFLYVALYLHESTLLLLAISGISAFLIIAINEERRFNLWRKGVYVLGLPITFALFYLLLMARLAALIGALFYRRPADARGVI